MLDFAELHSGLLDSTATYSCRAWGWFPADRNRPGEDGLGRLTLETWKSATGKKEMTQYVVERLRELPGLLGASYRLTKLDTVESYIVEIGGVVRCSCMAGQCRGKEGLDACKHLAAVQVLTERGLLDDPEPLENERSGLAFEDEPGTPTVAELTGAAG